MDDSRLQFGCQSCSVVLVVRCKSIQKCPIFARLQTVSLGQIKLENFSLVRGYLTNLTVLESSSVMCCIACKNKLRSLNFAGSVSFKKW